MIPCCQTGFKNGDGEAAKQFLAALDPKSKSFVFQTFDDLKTRRDPRLARTLHGSLHQLWRTLAHFNEQGAGVFVCINETAPGKDRKISNLKRVRAVWQDDDDGWQGDLPLAPSIVVQSSTGKYQRLWVLMV